MRVEKTVTTKAAWNNIRDELDNVSRILNALNIPVKPGSRIHQYRKILEFDTFDEFEKVLEKSSIKELYQVNLELYQISITLNHLKNSPYAQKWQDKIKFLADGHTLPEKDSNNLARNHQFELYVAVIMQIAGFNPKPKEPDILINLDSSDVAIAVKKPKSFKNIDSNLKSARRQIVNSSYPGIIFLDLSTVSNVNNKVMRTDDMSSATHHLINYLDKYIELNYTAIRNIVNSSSVFGIALHVNTLVETDKGITHSSRITVRNLCHHNDPYADKLYAFTNQISNTLLSTT